MTQWVLFVCAQIKPTAGINIPAGVFLRLHFAQWRNTMKMLVIAMAVVVGGIQIGFKAFDAGVASVEKTEVAQTIKARQAL